VVMALGLLLSAFGAAIAIDGTALAAAAQFRLTLVVFAVGQLLFLAPALVVGTAAMTPAELPTGSLVFNIATIGGTTLGAGIVSNFVIEREKFHSNVLAEGVTLYSPFDSQRVTSLADAFASRLTDDALATAQAAATLASSVRQQAWVLSFNDAFLVVAALLVISAAAVIAIGRSPALKHLHSIN
jgi:DHA2 family multidrug resistance protein